MWAPTKEATTAIRTRPSCFDGASTTKSTISHSCVLVHQVCILCPSALAKVFYLHHLWKHRHIHGRLRRLSKVMSGENLLVLKQMSWGNLRILPGINAPDGKHLCANIFAGTFVHLWASHLVTSLHVQDPPSAAVPLAKRAVAQPLHAPVHGQSRLLCPALFVQVLEVATHRTPPPDRHRLYHRHR